MDISSDSGQCPADDNMVCKSRIAARHRVPSALPVMRPLPENLYPEFSRPELRMRSLVAVCDAHLVTMEEQRRHELAALRRRARYERYRNKCNRKIETCDADLAVSVLYDGSRLEVRVQNPMIHLPTDGGRYTTYEIAIHTNNIAFTLPKSFVRRRYSDFQWIRKQLSSEHPDVNAPKLPPWTWWGGQFEPAIIEQRIRGLKVFLEKVLLQRVYLSNKALHLFIQSQLEPREIEHVISGRDQTSVTKHIMEASRLCGSRARCFGCREEEDCHDDNSSNCSSASDLKLIEDEYDTGITVLPTDLRADEIGYLENSTSDLDRSGGTDASSNAESKTPLCSTPLSGVPHRSWSDSALVLHSGDHNTTCEISDSESVDSMASSSSSSSKDESNSDIPDSAAAMACRHRSGSLLGRMKPVLSQSLPTTHALHMRCGHRKRRVTFNSEVTVAKVLETPEEEASGVALVQVHNNKGKTKE